MTDIIIKAGEKIRLFIQKADGSGKNKKTDKGRIYYSRVIRVEEENKIRVAVPMVNGKYIKLNRMEKYSIELLTKKGIYGCTGKIASYIRESRAYYLVFELLTEFEKLQRREYYRLDCMLRIKFKRAMDGDIYHDKKSINENKEKIVWHPAIVTNISGGGSRFNSAIALNINEFVMLKLHLKFDNGDKDFEIPAKVIFCQQLKDNNEVFEARVKYVNIPVKDREEIVRYVFEEERRIRKRKKGLI